MSTTTISKPTTPTKTITLDDAAKLISSIKDEKENNFFWVKFIKRTNGEIRDMTCHVNVKKYLKGGEPAYDFKEKNLVCVCDVTIARNIQEHFKAGTLDQLESKLKNPYRSINLDAIMELKLHGVHYQIG